MGVYFVERQECIERAFAAAKEEAGGNPFLSRNTWMREIMDDLGEFDCAVVSVSTGGQITGIGRRLKEALPGVRIIAVDSHGSVIFGGKLKPQLVRGVGLSWTPVNLDLDLIDEAYKVQDEDACIAARVVAVMPDRWEKYMEQIYNDRWMKEQGFSVDISPGLLYQRAMSQVLLEMTFRCMLEEYNA